MDTTSRHAGDATLHTALVVLASVGFGLTPLFARGLTETGMSPTSVALARYAIGAVVTLPFLPLGRETRAAVLWGVLAGLCMGLGWIGWVAALRTAPVAVVGVIYMTYPAFTLLIGRAAFGDRPSGRAWAGAGLVLLAAALAAGPAALAPGGATPALLIAFAAPAGFALGINILTTRLTRIPPLARIASVSLGTALGLLPLMVAQGGPGALPGGVAGWGLLLGIGLLTALGPQLVYVVSAPRIGAARAGVAGAVELPTMFAVGVLAFGEALSPAQILAGALVLVAILITPARAAARATARTGAARPPGR